MYLVKTPNFIQNLFPGLTWSMPSKDKEIFLTFDDGPISEVTPWVLEQLARYQAKATFFCVGDNIKKHPEVFSKVVDAGHAVGNHTYHHLNGWTNDNLPYFHDVRRCAELIPSRLFRPPYGRLRPRQVQFLQRHYRIVMWDILSGDFDPNITNEKCLSNVIDKAKPGSIIVLHDSLKAKDKLFYVLPRILEYFSKRGFRFSKLQDRQTPQKISKTA